MIIIYNPFHNILFSKTGNETASIFYGHLNKTYEHRELFININIYHN